MFRALFFSFLTLAVCFIGCASKPLLGDRSPTSTTPAQISKDGEECQADFDGDREVDRAAIGTAFGKRVLIIMHAASSRKKAHYHVEELKAGQTVSCVVNTEPGVSFRGTDEEQKGISVPLKADYLKIVTPEKDSRFLYFDVSVANYRTLWRAD